MKKPARQHTLNGSGTAQPSRDLNTRDLAQVNGGAVVISDPGSDTPPGPK